MSSFTAEERAALCEVRLQLLVTWDAQVCERQALKRSWGDIGGVAEPSVCQAQRDECIALRAPDRQDCDVDWYATCGAPFGLLEQCQFDVTAFNGSYPTCTTATDEQLAALAGTGELYATAGPKSCDEVLRLCPYEDHDGETNGVEAGGGRR